MGYGDVTEAKVLVRATDQSPLEFLYEDIFTHFGVLKDIVTDGGPHFVSRKIEALLRKYHIQHWIISPYHPEANGQVESSNKVIEAILKKP